ncbi:MAG: GyrI-like domain-containing protein, partial [Methanocorpusculum sp.]|nr:GyrI-like domain-containing protein [Methanocorpusculum sp.]
CFRVDLDREYRDHDINIEYCQAVEEKGVDVGDIIFKTIPAVTVVSVMHKGAYEHLGQAYAYVFKWIEENGFETTDEPPRESYIDGIWNKEDVADWLTEIQVPILKK